MYPKTKDKILRKKNNLRKTQKKYTKEIPQITKDKFLRFIQKNFKNQKNNLFVNKSKNRTKEVKTKDEINKRKTIINTR